MHLPPRTHCNSCLLSFLLWPFIPLPSVNRESPHTVSIVFPSKASDLTMPINAPHCSIRSLPSVARQIGPSSTVNVSHWFTPVFYSKFSSSCRFLTNHLQCVTAEGYDWISLPYSSHGRSTHHSIAQFTLQQHFRPSNDHR